MTTTPRRTGTTLMEVLIATMILTIGLVAIMTLFPIGAVNMARAINQDRSTTHGVNSDAMLRFYWKQAWNDPATGTVRPSNLEAYGYSQEPMLFLLENHVGYGSIPSNSSQPSFPVLVDPVGWQTNAPGSPGQYYVAGNSVAPNLASRLPMRTTLRRCININNGYPLPWALVPSPPPGPLATVPLPPPISLPPAAPQPVTPPYPSMIGPSLRLTTMLDDFTYTTEGQPDTSPGQLQRGGRYNVAWLIQRSRNDVPAEVNVNVLVYAGRSPADTPSPETAFSAAVPGGAGTKQIILSLPNGQGPPALRRGLWVAWSMPVTPEGGPPAVTYPVLDFYRVVGVNDEVPGQLSIEVEAPIKSYGSVNNQNYVNGNGAVVVFENLFEVFERGSVSPSSVVGR
jgi:hypothetical protein